MFYIFTAYFIYLLTISSLHSLKELNLHVINILKRNLLLNIISRTLHDIIMRKMCIKCFSHN